MGADIHAYVECKDVNTGKWKAILVENPFELYYSNKDDKGYHPYIQPYDGRNYYLFGILAGVRANVYPQIDDPRGLPCDMSDALRKLWDDGDGWWHTPSWYSLAELRAWADKKRNFRVCDYSCIADSIEIKAQKDEDKHMRETFKSLVSGVEFMSDLYNHGLTPASDVRLVFWFDS